MRFRSWLLWLAVAAFGLAVSAVAVPASAKGTTVWAVGDGADSGTADDAMAAMIAARSPDAFLYLGDVYESGTADEFSRYYAAGYGRLKPITRPTPGNHEWGNRSSGYDPYWGPAYSSPHYYGFDLGDWHLISLNSEEPHGDGSAELSWLRSELAARSGTCTIAYWHRPRYSAGFGHGDDSSMEPIWEALAGHASIVLTGHDHDYQRLKPIDGITPWVVGTGGHSLYGVDSSDSRLAAWNASDYGALRLVLSSERADYAFVNPAGAVLDKGSVTCRLGGLDAKAPVLSRLRFTRKRHGHSRGTFRYMLTETARVTFTFKKFGRTVGRLSQRGKRGRNRKRFSGRLGGRALRRGRYRVVARATDDSGNRSRRRSLRITISRR